MDWMEAFYAQLWRVGVMPVVVLERLDDAVPVAEALVAGGLPAAEVTFRTPVAATCITAMREAFPDMCLGAGTVLSCEDVDRTIAAGGTFVVSPGFDAEVVQYCLDRKIPVLPGAVTPTEHMDVRRMGLSVSKFFHAGVFGGITAINSLAAPFVGHRFVPTGGVNAENLRTYLENPHVIACGGTWIARPSLIGKGRFDEVRRLALDAADTVRAVRG